jgi:hypothetical protein
VGHFCPLGSGSEEPIESGPNPDPQHCLAVVLPNLTGETTFGRLHDVASHAATVLRSCRSKRSLHVLKFKWKTAWNQCFGSRMTRIWTDHQIQCVQPRENYIKRAAWKLTNQSTIRRECTGTVINEMNSNPDPNWSTRINIAVQNPLNLFKHSLGYGLLKLA